MTLAMVAISIWVQLPKRTGELTSLSLLPYSPVEQTLKSLALGLLLPAFLLFLSLPLFLPILPLQCSLKLYCHSNIPSLSNLPRSHAVKTYSQAA